MITINQFKNQEKETAGEKMTDLHVRFRSGDLAAIEKYAAKFEIPKASAVRYFCLLGMQAHRKRNALRKRCESIAGEDMIREATIEEFHRRFAAEEHITENQREKAAGSADSNRKGYS